MLFLTGSGRTMSPAQLAYLAKITAAAYVAELTDIAVEREAFELDEQQRRAQRGLRILTPQVDLHGCVVAARDRVPTNRAYG